MGVDGNVIYGVASIQLVCSKSSGTGGYIDVRGKIASDGSFMLEGSIKPGATPFLTIKGKLPEEGTIEWSGSMATTGELASGLNCTTPHVDFLASRLVPLNGTYIGSALDNSGNSVSIKVELAQGGFTPTDQGEFAASNLMYTDHNIPHALPLIGTVTISNSSGIITADSVRAFASDVYGAHWMLLFILKDDSSLEVEGNRSDPSGDILSVVVTLSPKDQDGQAFFGSGSLTRH
jgi:hypothetical protein